MTTGQRMKARRKEIGLSAERVAELLNVSPATIYRYENGDIEKVPGDRLEPIAAALQTTPQALMGWEDFRKVTDPEGERKTKLRSVARLESADITPEMDRNITDYIDFLLKKKEEQE